MNGLSKWYWTSSAWTVSGERGRPANSTSTTVPGDTYNKENVTKESTTNRATTAASLLPKKVAQSLQFISPSLSGRNVGGGDCTASPGRNPHTYIRSDQLIV